MDQPILEQTGTYKDFKWCVLFQPFGYRTAYVLVPNWHKMFEVDYNDIVQVDKNIKFRLTEALSAVGIDVTVDQIDDILETQFGGTGVL